VGGYFLPGMKCADADVESEPSKEQPPRPVMAKKQKDTTEDGEKTHSKD
jgi:hypothetical protein